MTASLRIPAGEFVALIGLMMAIGALSLDMILPGLGILGQDLAIASANDRQLVITAFLGGIGVGQLFYGPLSDVYGRKPVLLAGLALFVAGAVWAARAGTFESLLAARLLQGLGAAAPRVISTAVVRDLFVGNRMARIVSFSMIVFIIVPIFAPALGMLVLVVSTWHAIFLFMAAFALALAAWCSWRLPETHDRERHAGERLSRQLLDDMRAVLRVPLTLGYTLAIGLLFGLLMTYVATAQQVFQDIYGLGDDFPVAFGAIAAVIAVANLLNARFVERVGAERIAHTAMACLTVVTGTLLVLSLDGNPSLPVFGAFTGMMLFLFALSGPNLNALAMVPVGHVAGSASSLLGFSTTLVSAFIGWLVGQQLDHTVLPLAAGIFLASLSALIVATYTRKRFRSS